MFKSIIYLILSLSLIFYNLPKLAVKNSFEISTIYSLLWLSLALIIVGAQIDNLINYDSKRQIRIEQLKKIKLWEKEQALLKEQVKSIDN